jgi:hypothetical protein
MSPIHDRPLLITTAGGGQLAAVLGLLCQGGDKKPPTAVLDEYTFIK